MLASVLIAALTLIIAAPAVPPARAVIPIGPGYQIPNPYRDSIIGGYLGPDGSILYCLEWGKESPTGPNDTVLNIESTAAYAAWSHLEVARVNYLITTWGQTRDNDQAAAVAMAIWMRHPGTLEPFFSEHRFVKATIPNAEQRARIAQRAQQMNTEANQFTPHARAAIGAVEIHPDPNNPLAGEVRVVSVPEQASGTLMMDGGVFETTESVSVAGASVGDVYRYRGVPSDDEMGSFEVSVDATFVMPGGPGDELVVWSTPQNFQDLGQASESIPDFHFSLQATQVNNLTFRPELTTQAAEQLVTVGVPLRDELRVTMASESLEWRQLSDGTYVEIEAWCQAYGPLREQPLTTETPPTDAPAFGERVTVTLGGTDVHPSEQVVEAEFEERPKRAGFYTFVCGVDQSAQSSEAAAASLPVAYEFEHEYGLRAETTQVTAPLAETGGTMTIGSATGILSSLISAGLVLMLFRMVRARTQASGVLSQHTKPFADSGN